MTWLLSWLVLAEINRIFEKIAADLSNIDEGMLWVYKATMDEDQHEYAEDYVTLFKDIAHRPWYLSYGFITPNTKADLALFTDGNPDRINYVRRYVCFYHLIGPLRLAYGIIQLPAVIYSYLNRD